MSPKENLPVVLSTNAFPVIGVGASAGGLEAFKAFLKAIPEKSGMAYVLVQHLAPDHESFLAGILQKFTKIPVAEIADEVKVLPDHIYIIPSNKMLIANDGVLQLSPRPDKNENILNLPVDVFLKSLAEIHQSHAIGVVLSGNGADGTQGLKAIKDMGGITLAQDNASALYDGMPYSAILAGVVDFVLPPGKMPGKLLEITKQFSLGSDEGVSGSVEDQSAIKQILALLRLRKGTDFTYYKQTTIRRRILRRMVVNHCDTPSEYLVFVRESKGEQDTLYQDLLIPVTSFFRDSHVFENLCEMVFPHIADKETVVRIWIAGCSTGQEAYSDRLYRNNLR